MENGARDAWKGMSGLGTGWERSLDETERRRGSTATHCERQCCGDIQPNEKWKTKVEHTLCFKRDEKGGGINPTGFEWKRTEWSTTSVDKLRSCLICIDPETTISQTPPKCNRIYTENRYTGTAI